MKNKTYINNWVFSNKENIILLKNILSIHSVWQSVSSYVFLSKGNNNPIISEHLLSARHRSRSFANIDLFCPCPYKSLWDMCS